MPWEVYTQQLGDVASPPSARETNVMAVSSVSAVHCSCSARVSPSAGRVSRHLLPGASPATCRQHADACPSPPSPIPTVGRDPIDTAVHPAGPRDQRKILRKPLQTPPPLTVDYSVVGPRRDRTVDAASSAGVQVTTVLRYSYGTNAISKHASLSRRPAHADAHDACEYDDGTLTTDAAAGRPAVGLGGGRAAGRTC